MLHRSAHFFFFTFCISLTSFLQAAERLPKDTVICYFDDYHPLYNKSLGITFSEEAWYEGENAFRGAVLNYFVDEGRKTKIKQGPGSLSLDEDYLSISPHLHIDEPGKHDFNLLFIKINRKNLEGAMTYYLKGEEGRRIIGNCEVFDSTLFIQKIEELRQKYSNERAKLYHGNKI